MKQNTLWLGAAAVFVAGCVYWYTSAPISTADAKRYGAECEGWISKEFGGGRAAKVIDSWRKKGQMVFEVLVAKDAGSASDVFLCVVDKSKGTIRKPSAFDPSWR